MGKSRSKNGKEDEYFKGQIRKLESEIRQLRKENKSLQKRAHFYEEVVSDEAEDIQIKNTCSSCKHGNKIILDLVHVKLESCDTCDYRKKLK